MTKSKGRSRGDKVGNSIPPLMLLGGGEHARVVSDLIHTCGGYALKGFWGPIPNMGLSYLGNDEELRRQFHDGLQTTRFHLAMVGRPGSEARKTLLRGFSDLPIRWETLLHPTAFVSATAVLGEGCFIGLSSVIHTQARIGDHVVINTGAIIEHDVRIAEGCHIAPGAVLGGGVEIGPWAWIGLGACIRDHVHIGEGAVVAMGAVVVTDVPPGAWVKGVPARELAGKESDD